MRHVDVCWLSLTDAPARDYWDQAMVERLLSGRLWPLAATFEHWLGVDDLPVGRGACVVVPARYHAERSVLDALNAKLARLPWMVLFLTSDEESLFPWWRVSHPNCRMWVMTPRPGQHPKPSAGGAVPERYVGEGWAPGTPEMVAGLRAEADARPLRWFFAGQVTHERRQQAAAAMRTMSGGIMVSTKEFAKGIGFADYMLGMVSAKVVPCPSGPATPDSFRAYEALEAGAVPVVDAVCPAYGREGYWPLVLGDDPPFPVLCDWTDLPAVTDTIVADWPASGNRAQAWWQGYKRRLATDLATDLDHVGAPREARSVKPSLAELITVVVPTSPIGSHPSTAVIEETLGSVWAHEALAGCETIVAVDGVRDEQRHRQADYDEYVRRLLWLTGHVWPATLPLLAPGHVHQANTTRAALEAVRTPLVLFVEHDTPLVGEIDWRGIADTILARKANVVRLLHEAHVLDVHRHLMLDEEPVDLGVPVIRTAQWSQRPQVAFTRYYQHVIGTYFGRDSRTFIEDVMHGVVDNAWRRYGRNQRAWDRHRLAIYAPADGVDWKRSTHTDGRGDEPKYPMRFGYDGRPTPPGAPNALRDEDQ